MSHGQQDFGMYAPKKTVYGQADMAELAVRLGSIVSFDRRGDVIWLDDFESAPNKWSDGGGGTGHDYEISGICARSGGYSGKLTCGSDGTYTAQISTYLPPPVLSKIGLEFHFTHPVNYLTMLTAYLYVRHYNEYWEAAVRLDPVNEILQVRNVLTWETVAENIKIGAWIYNFLPMKFVIDLENDTYTRLRFYHLDYDITSKSLRTGTAGYFPAIFIAINAKGTSGQNPVLYIDDVIVTQNEP